MRLSLAKSLIPAPVQRRVRAALAALGFELPFLRLRRPGLRALRGSGLEIGAFEHPAPIPRRCKVSYVDVITPEEAKRRFPEIDIARLVRVDHIVDLDRDGLGVFGDQSQDFVVACHVIEHLANPGRFVADLLRVLRPGGRLVIAAPDRDYTFDRNRPLTDLETLRRFHIEGRGPIGPEHYRDIVLHIQPELMQRGPVEVAAALARFHDRREHLSVWTAASVREFLVAAMEWSGVSMLPEYEVFSDKNQFEYFGVWRRGGAGEQKA